MPRKNLATNLATRLAKLSYTTKNLATLFLIAIIAFAVFAACKPKTENAPSGEIVRLFTNAGLRLLDTRITPRDFSLELSLPTQEEQTLTLSALKGKVVFLNFWATWCPPCREEMPSMESLYNRYKDSGLEIVAVNIMESADLVNSFFEEYALTFPAPLDSTGQVSRTYGVQAIPTSFIIDREGLIAARLVGSIDWDTPQIHAVFESLLSE
jgi:thiol-disulfide isomerase/thioredoxin